MSDTRRIALIFAMEVEAQPLLSHFDCKKVHAAGLPEGTPFRYYKSTLSSEIELIISLNGKDQRQGVDNIGTEPAAVNCFATIQAWRPDLVISVGTAGSFAKHGAAIGDVYLSHKFIHYHDHRISLRGFQEYGLGCFPSLDVAFLARELSLKQGDVSSGNSLEFNDTDLEYFENNKAVLKEMEAAGIAWVCHFTSTPFFAIKSVTNLIDVNPDSAHQFHANLSLATTQLGAATIQVIESISKSKLDWLIGSRN